MRQRQHNSMGCAPLARSRGSAEVSFDTPQASAGDTSRENLYPPDVEDLASAHARGRKSDPSIRLSVTPELLTTKQAGKFLGVPPGTLAQWRSERRGPPYIKLEGRLVRYRAADLQDYLSRHTVETEIDIVSAKR